MTTCILTKDSRPERHGDAGKEASAAGKYNSGCSYNCKPVRVLIGQLAKLQVRDDARIC
jgi:hypothetical protein